MTWLPRQQSATGRLLRLQTTAPHRVTYKSRCLSVADNRTYNARVTTEALEKKFRDTFPSQAGAELVDDLYASGVIVPVVDFTAAAEGSALRSDLQTAMDFATQALFRNTAGTSNLTTSPGFWRLFGTASIDHYAGAAESVEILISDGVSTKHLFFMVGTVVAGADEGVSNSFDFNVFVRSGDTLQLRVINGGAISVTYRQIADVYGNLVNPLGFTSS